MKVMKAVNDFFREHIAPPHKIISVQKQKDGEEEGWRALVEIIEEKEYMKRYGHDQMIGLYEVFLDKENEVTGFSRISLRFRSDLEEQA
ncbi:gas vesicle protein GvpR [Oceanobacillus piezotolerans]|uniref:Gas vesicle protein GvpR n=1 Tax=Oceanobacillus piezotolerans TaxID=2448030 RepID=A0A498D6A4_9BACI|nr:gas vesicle protein GvpO [Oceanobacillus piezotolerans]RLL42684.1 gas vesicle protein GvpR [Oceanobacillus piezotolerans]